MLAGLARRLRVDAAAPLAALFRWVCEDDSVLRYESSSGGALGSHQTVLKPDAIVEIQACKRRLFLWISAVARKLRFYDPRHTHATLLRMAGVDVVAVQRSLGHSSSEITAAVYELSDVEDDVFRQVLPSMVNAARTSR